MTLQFLAWVSAFFFFFLPETGWHPKRPRTHLKPAGLPLSFADMLTEVWSDFERRLRCSLQSFRLWWQVRQHSTFVKHVWRFYWKNVTLEQPRAARGANRPDYRVIKRDLLLFIQLIFYFYIIWLNLIGNRWSGWITYLFIEWLLVDIVKSFWH